MNNSGKAIVLKWWVLGSCLAICMGKLGYHNSDPRKSLVWNPNTHGSIVTSPVRTIADIIHGEPEKGLKRMERTAVPFSVAFEKYIKRPITQTQQKEVVANETK